jgi:hypothetical protein
MATKISKAIVISSHDSKNQWVVTEFQTIDGDEYIPLHSRDVGFVRFVFGSVKPLTKSTFYRDLRTLRTTATVKALQEPRPEQALFGGVVKNGWRQLKRQRQDCQHAANKPDVVTITMPQVVHDDKVFAARDVKVKASLDATAIVWVQLGTEVIDHIRAGIVTSMSDDAKVTKHISWRQQDKCYIAAKKHAGKMSYKRFRPEGCDDASQQAAYVAAEQWLTDAELPAVPEEEHEGTN